MRRTAQHSYYLMLRALRESTRQPAVELTNIFIPMFFFAVTVGAIGNIAARAFGVENYLGFQMPVAILQGVAGIAGSAGMGTVMDIERGYFDKLLLTPASRVSLVLGRIAGDAVRAEESREHDEHDECDERNGHQAGYAEERLARAPRPVAGAPDGTGTIYAIYRPRSRQNTIYCMFKIRPHKLLPCKNLAKIQQKRQHVRS